MGRAYKFTEDVAKKLIDGVRSGLHKQVAAWNAGVSPDSLDRWVAAGDSDESSQFTEFARAFRAAESEAEKELVDRLRGLALGTEDGNHQPTEAFLKRRWPKRWGDRAVLEQSGLDGGPIRHEISPAEIQAKVAARFGSAATVEQKGNEDGDDSPDRS